MVNILGYIPKLRTIIAWKLAQILREKKHGIVTNKKSTKTVIPSMLFNPFEFKQGRRREPKDVDQPTAAKKKKCSKCSRQPLVLHKQQLCKYHQPIVYPYVYPGDGHVMVITVDPIVIPRPF